MAHTPSGPLAALDQEPLLRQALTASGARLHEVAAADGSPVLEVVKPFHLGAMPLGLLRIGLQTTHIVALWRRSLLFLSASGLGMLVIGGMGLSALFRAQARHHERVRVLERSLTHQERLAALGHLAAGVAHEVRHPLNAIGMGIQRLERECAPAHAAEEFHTLCRLIRDEVARLNTIVQEFLTLARTPTLQRASIAVTALLQEVTALLEAEAQARAVRLTVQIPTSLAPLSLDRQQMPQALLNLLLNALQATPPGGAVQVTVEAGATEIRITIADQGSGIAPELLERIFDPYFTTKPEWTGLGLPIALQIIQAHGGTLDARSVPGQGTTVDVHLPSGPVDGGSGPGGRTSGGSLMMDPLTILVVDDESAQRELLGGFLAKQGWSVERAAAELGISERVLRYKVRKHHLQAETAEDATPVGRTEPQGRLRAGSPSSLTP